MATEVLPTAVGPAITTTVLLLKGTLQNKHLNVLRFATILILLL